MIYFTYFVIITLFLLLNIIFTYTFTAFLKMILGTKNELYIKYSVLLSSLSRLIEYKEKFNINQTQKEIKTAIKYEDLLKLQNEKEKEFNNFYLDLPINKLKNNKELRTKNIKLLLLSFYVCVPPLRRELFDCKIIKNEEDKDTYDNTIYIKDKNNIFVLFLFNGYMYKQ